MRIEPENSLLEAEFTTDNTLIDVWDGQFPVKREDYIKARHFNALWAALTERGRLVGLQVHDWVALFPPVVTGATPTPDGTPTWSWSSGGGVGDGNYRYKLDDSDLTAGATATTDTSFTPGAPISNGAHTLYVQEKNAAGRWSPSGSFEITIDPMVLEPDPPEDPPDPPDDATEWNRPIKGMVRPEDLTYWDDLDSVTADDVSNQHIQDLLEAIDAVCRRYVHPEEARLFLGMGDLLAYTEIGESKNDEAYWGQEDWTNSDYTYDSWGFIHVPERDGSEEADEDDKADAFLYRRTKPGSTKVEDIMLNDPRYSDNGGGYGEAQYGDAWEYASLAPQIPNEILVEVSDEDQMTPIPEGEDKVSVPLPPFHEHINSVYYLIRALEWLPFSTGPTPQDQEEITIQNDGFKITVLGTSVCQVFQKPDGQGEDMWTKFIQQRFAKAMNLESTATSVAATLFGFARQETYYACPTPPIGPVFWVALNTKTSRFISYVPFYEPWNDDDENEQEEFPEGFPGVYTANTLRFFLNGSAITTQAAADAVGQLSPGWGGEAKLMLLTQTTPPLEGSGDSSIVSGEEVLSVPVESIDGVVDLNEEVTTTTVMPNTVAALESAFAAFNLHFNLDPGKWKAPYPPNNEPPRVETPDVGAPPGKNHTESTVVVDALVALKFEDHTYSGGFVADMEL